MRGAWACERFDRLVACRFALFGVASCVDGTCGGDAGEAGSQDNNKRESVYANAQRSAAYRSSPGVVQLDRDDVLPSWLCLYCRLFILYFPIVIIVSLDAVWQDAGWRELQIVHVSTGCPS